VIEKDVPIGMVMGRYHVVVDLGPLPMGVTGIAKLKLINPHQVNFSVNALELGCSCTSAEISADEIGPNSSATLIVTLSTRPTSRSQNVSVSVTLVSKADKSKNVTMALRYSLAGLMAFAGTSYAQEVDASLDRQTVTIPFLMTDPVTAKDVTFEIVPASDGVVASLVKKEGKHFVTVVFDPVFVSDESMPLSVIARDESRDLTDTLPLLLCKRKYLEITPRTLRFQSEDEQLIAACLLRYRPPLVESKQADADNDSKEGAINMEASLGDVKLNVRAKKLGRGIYRVFLQGSKNKLQESLAEEKKPSVQWRVTTPDKVYSVESLLSVGSSVSFSPTTEEGES
tara:strand:- start:1656 stop:2681 length:1026 start_codon:yes stop_codon:yes gene_type:complete